MQLVPVQAERLEQQFQPKLQVACVEGATSLSERGVANAVMELAFGTGQLEVGVVENVETLSPELQVGFLGDFEVLEQ